MRRSFAWGSRLKGILAIGGGTLAGQVVLVGTTPLLSRIYSPEVFGAFSTLMAMVSIIGSVAALKFDAGIVLPEGEREASSLLRLALFGSAMIAVLSAGGVWAMELLGLGQTWSAVAFAPLWMAALVFLTALVTILTQVALRRQAYSAVAKRSPIQSITTAFSQLGLGLLAPNPAGLIGGAAIGHLGGLAPLVRMARELLRVRGVSWKRTVRSYWRLPVILAPSALMNTLGSQIPLLMIAAFFGASVVGEFGMSQRLVYIPAVLIGTAVAQVFASELAKHLREGGKGATRIYLRSSGLLALLAVPVAAVIALLGPWLLPIVLGPEWALAGEFCPPLAILMGLSLIVTPTSQVYILFQSAASLVVDLSRILLLLGAAGLHLLWGLGAIETVWMMVVAQTINYSFTWIYGIRVTRNGRI